MPFPPTVKNFSSQYLQAHNDLRAWTHQRGATDVLEGRAALQRDLSRLRGAAKRLTEAKENSCVSISFWPPVQERL